MALLVGASLALIIPVEDMQAWGWRIPFLLAIPLGVIALYIRSRVSESPVFERLEALHGTAEHPLRTLLTTKRGWKMLGRTAFINLPASVPAYLLVTFMPSFLQANEDFTPIQSLLVVLAGVACTFLFIPISGRLSDRLGRRRILFGICVLQLVLAWPAFALLTSGNVPAAVVGLMLLGTMNGAAIGAQSAPLLETFPTLNPLQRVCAGARTVDRDHRRTHALRVGLAGKRVRQQNMAPMWLIIACAVPSLFASFFIKETAGQPLLTDAAPHKAP